MHRLLLVLPILAVAAPVYADPCGDARAELKAKDLARAWIDAQACGDETLIADVEARVEKAGYSPVEVVTDPDGGTVVVEPAPDRPFVAPMRVWLPPGRHYVTAIVDGQPVAQTVAVAKDGNRASALLSLPPPPDPAKTGVVDMGEEGGGEMSSGPPPKTEMPSLLPDRYQRGVDKRPLSWTVSPTTRPLERWRLAIGLTGGTGEAFGGEVAFEHRRRAFDRDQSIVPGVAVGVLSVPDTDGRAFVVDLTGAVLYEVRFRVPHFAMGVAVGPAVSYVAGVDALAGVGAGGAAAVSLTRGGGTGTLRLDAPLWSTAERIASATFLLGHRW